MIDIVNPNDDYSVSDFKLDSENVIDKLKLLTDEQFAEIEFPMD